MTPSKLGPIAQAVLAAVSLAAGAVIGLGGCGWPCNCGDSPGIESGTYEVVGEFPTSSDQSRPELIGGIVEVDQERVELSFTDVDGQDWVVDYVVLP